MDWFHCNGCYLQASKNEDLMNFILTNCGHIFCQRCAGGLTDGKCGQCQQDCRTLKFDNNLPADVSVFFRDIAYYTQQAVNCQKEALSHLSNFAKAKKFQDGQREHLNAHLKVKKHPSNSVTTEEFQQLQHERAADAQTISRLQNELTKLTTFINSNPQHPRGNHPMHRMVVTPTQSLQQQQQPACLPSQAIFVEKMPSRAGQGSRSSAVYVVPQQSRHVDSRHGYVVSKAAPPGMQTPASGQSIQKPQYQETLRGGTQLIRVESAVGSSYGVNQSYGQLHQSGNVGSLVPQKLSRPSAVTQTGMTPARQPQGSGPSNASGSTGGSVLTNVTSGSKNGKVSRAQMVSAVPPRTDSRISTSTQSSRLVAGPTYRPTQALTVKRYKL